jgi:SAM-dependent methyltransferase
MASGLKGLWYQVLLQGQEEIQKSANPYYRDQYRPQEVFYWSYLPRWMSEDWAIRLPKRVLDIGCGYGTLLLYARRMTVCEAYGIDFIDSYYHPEFFSKWRMKFALTNIEYDNPPFEPGFDSIILSEVVEHFNFKPLPTLKRIVSLLNDNGVLYLSTPDGEACGRITTYIESLDDYPELDKGRAHKDGHTWQYSETELRQLLAAAGLKILHFDRSPGAFNQHFNLTAMKAGEAQ